MRFAGDLDIAAIPPPGGTLLDGADVHHAGKRFQARLEGAEESSDLWGGFVALLRQGREHDENVVGAEAEMFFAEGDEAAHEEAGADEQSQRKRDFEDDHGVAETAMAETAAHALAGIAQWIVEIAARDL